MTIRIYSLPSAEAVSATVALEPIPLPHVTSLHHLDDPLAAAAAEGVPADAVTIEEGPVVELGIFVKTMVDAAVDDAGEDWSIDVNTENNHRWVWN